MRCWAKEFFCLRSRKRCLGQILMTGYPLPPGADMGARTNSQHNLETYGARAPFKRSGAAKISCTRTRRRPGSA